MLSIFGIDPGYSGAIAIYRPEANKLEIHDMPIMLNHAGKNIIDCHTLLHLLEPETKNRFAVFKVVPVQAQSFLLLLFYISCFGKASSFFSFC